MGVPPRVSKTQVVVTTLLVFLVADFTHNRIILIEGFRSLPWLVRWLEQPVWCSVVCGIGWFLLHRGSLRELLADFGLAAPIGPALRFGFLATSPMWVASLFMGRPLSVDSSVELLFLSAIWPLGEEILFRGFAFGQLHRRAGWNLWVAALVTGATFGAGHLVNASIQRMPWSEQVGTIALIGGGGVLFAWLFARWQHNLWIPWSLHAFMNLWWTVFALSDSPLGGWGANAMRAGVVILAIVLTVYRAKLPAFLRC